MSNVVNGIIGATVNAVGALNGSVGIGKYIVNDYVLTLEPLPTNDGYTLTIRKGSDVQTVTLEGLSEENLEIFRGYVAAAQAAQLAAEGAQGNAEDAQAAAEAAQSLAETAKAAAETAETNAGASATQAGTSASSAAQSATQAAGSAAAAAQTLTDVQAAGQAQIAAIGAEGERVLETIPEDYTELSDDVDLLKAEIATKIGFENIATKTMFSTGLAEYDSSKIASTRRWFVNHVFPAGVHFGTIRFGSTANSSNPDRVQYFEVWTKSGTRLTKVKTVSVDVSETTASQEVHYFEADIDYSAEAECMICLRPTGNPTSMLYTVDASGADNLIVSSDVNADTSSLDYSDLSTFGIKVYPDMEITYTVETKVNVVLIGQGMDYDEIQDAINAISDDNESNPYTLVVMPKGAAYKPFSMLRESFDDTYPWSDVSPRYISIIGIDKKHCVIRSDSGNYNRPCGEPMTNGIIRNLSFVMTNDDQDINATQGGYCLHIDCRTAEDAGYSMVIENCDFENASGPCIGIGTHKNCALTIRRCNMRTALSANYAPHSGYTNLYNYGVVFCHTSRRSDATDQSITIEDCVGVCAEGSKSLWIAATEEYDPTTASFTYALFRNVFYNMSAGAPAYSISSSLTANPANVGNDTWLKAYVKPSGGIPSTDMSSAVQTSLAKADTALQSAPVTSVAGKTGAVTLDAGDVEYDGQDSYASGTVGAEVGNLKTEMSTDEYQNTQIFHALTPEIKDWSISASTKIISDSIYKKTAVYHVEVGKTYTIISSSAYLRTARSATNPAVGDTVTYYEVHDGEGKITSYTPSTEYVLVVYYDNGVVGAKNADDIYMVEQKYLPEQIISDFTASDNKIYRDIYETDHIALGIVPPVSILEKCCIPTGNKTLATSNSYNVAVYKVDAGYCHILTEGSRCRGADYDTIPVIGDTVKNYNVLETSGYMKALRTYLCVEYTIGYAPPVVYIQERGRGIPYYYDTQISETEASVTANIATVGKDGETFVFVTDSHVGSNVKSAPPIIKKLVDDLPVHTVIHGGDMMDSGVKATEIANVRAFINLFDYMHHGFLYVLGNHDENKNQHESSPSYWLSRPETYELYNAKSENYMHDYGYCYYYYDIPATKTRIIVVDIAYGSIDSTQKTWITDLLTASTDKNVIIAGHYLREDGGAYTLDGAWLCGLTSTYSCIKAIVHGHAHYDQDDRTATGVCVIGVDRDGYNRLSTHNKYTAAQGQVTETAFDTITVNYLTGDVFCQRIGRGVNRIERAGVTEVATTATLTSSLTGTLTWESSDTSVATVSDGVVTAVAAGSAMITAYDSGRNSEIWKVTVV